MALANSGAFLSVNHIPPLPIPHGLAHPLGSRMHLGVVHPRLEARGRPFPRSPWSRSHVNLRVLRPLTRGSQGQPSPLRTPHGRPGVQGIFPAARGQVPHGWPMVHHSMATGFPIPRGCCLALSVSLSIPCPIPLCVIPAPARSQRPMDSLLCRAVVRPWPHALPRPVPLSHHPEFLPHRVASNPVARAHWILFDPGTASCA